ncbi:hypothetical protein [Granulicella tundricola]|uniref:Uncharacterized protein n=1 Tax=Granulicella tundricola (strain ATCC BAA-1859 / DSM 23138 / MP5ACTX9) TaxID=1198114 RepID=E8X4R0_GRATM|nr:hypothetical protein [Granulicella tundricola]ADW70549.1 hypothetical protein AciX9_3545 [Granulicella tundricola MP5ACTX9]
MHTPKLPLNVTHVELIKDCGIIICFSDDTSAAYTSEELACLRPYRAPLLAANAS